MKYYIDRIIAEEINHAIKNKNAIVFLRHRFDEITMVKW
jgi:hypothetical protein